ncbi:DUF6020 family protein [Pontibacillus salicampi]|uniref:DUF6020 family protein n=2 Tax=Pontibacillus salicampi TaxID=1449801 RepID=A0ABV6LS97_9BACI
MIWTIGLSFLGSVAMISLYQSYLATSWVVQGLVWLVMFGMCYSFSRHLRSGRKGILRWFRDRINVLFVFGYSFLLWLSMRGTMEHLHDNAWYVTAFVYVGSYLSLCLTVWYVGYLLTKHSYPSITRRSSYRWIWWYALPMILSWGLYLLAFYPGIMGSDSHSHWEQAHTHEYSNWHPVLYTWFIEWLLKLFHSPATVAFAQIILLATIVGYGLYSFRKVGMEKRLLWFVSLFLALLPINGLYSILLLKDVLYSGSILFVTIVLFNIVATRGKWLTSVGHQFIFGLSMFGMVAFRHNGVYIVYVVLFLLCVCYYKYMIRILLPMAVVLFLFYYISGPVYEEIGVSEKNPNEKLGIPQQQIANVLVQNGKITDEQKAYIHDIMPIEKWKEYYNPTYTDPIKFAKSYNSDVIFEEGDPSTFYKTWLSIVAENPYLATEAFLKQTSLVWQMHQRYTDRHEYYNFRTTIQQPNDHGLQTEPKLNGLNGFLTKVAAFTEHHMWPVVWRPAVYAAILLLSLFIAIRKNGWKAGLVGLPVLLNIGTILAGIPAQHFRYLYANVLIFLFLILLALWKQENKPIQKKELEL